MLAVAGIAIEAGLTETELVRVESAVKAPLPPDLRAFLSEGLPTGGRFPDWRDPLSDAIRDQLAWPFEGIAFDIEHNTFWLDAWGLRPPDLREALEIARSHVNAAPRLIPIAGHRYIPAEPALPGNPVLSVYQSDIIYYGNDLATYLRCEFNRLPYADAVHDTIRRVRFWSDLVDDNA
ncbi:MAG: hypothetical protein QM756_35245 [Polyangiaceae bacterium]